MRRNQLPSHERLAELFVYDHESGNLIRRLNGRVAGCVRKSNGYRQVSIDGSLFYVHRIVWKLATGRDPEGDVDHIDLDKDNNRFLNLREATRSQNKANTALRVTNKSGAKGVSLYKGKKWRARITVRGREIALGFFTNVWDAKAAYDAAAQRYFGEFARAS